MRALRRAQLGSGLGPRSGRLAALPPTANLPLSLPHPTPPAWQDWVLYLSAAQRQGADAAELAELEQAAAATGLPLTGAPALLPRGV